MGGFRLPSCGLFWCLDRWSLWEVPAVRAVGFAALDEVCLAGRATLFCSNADRTGGCICGTTAGDEKKPERFILPVLFSAMFCGGACPTVPLSTDSSEKSAASGDSSAPALSRVTFATLSLYSRRRLLFFVHGLGSMLRREARAAISGAVASFGAASRGGAGVGR